MTDRVTAGEMTITKLLLKRIKNRAGKDLNIRTQTAWFHPKINGKQRMKDEGAI